MNMSWNFAIVFTTPCCLQAIKNHIFLSRPERAANYDYFENMPKERNRDARPAQDSTLNSVVKLFGCTQRQKGIQKWRQGLQLHRGLSSLSTMTVPSRLGISLITVTATSHSRGCCLQALHLKFNDRELTQDLYPSCTSEKLARGF